MFGDDQGPVIRFFLAEFLNIRYDFLVDVAAVFYTDAAGVCTHLLDGIFDIADIPVGLQKDDIFGFAGELAQSISSQLGNTPAIAIKNYTNPMLVEHMLKSYGFSAQQLEGENASEKAATKAIDMSKLSLLKAVYGEEPVREWASAFVDGDEDAEDSEHWEE